MTGARRAAEAIHAMGVRNVVITLGGDGSLIYDGGRFEYVDAFRVAAVDTTAAGDTYNGVLACCMAEGQGLVGGGARGKRSGRHKRYAHGGSDGGTDT